MSNPGPSAPITLKNAQNHVLKVNSSTDLQVGDDNERVIVFQMPDAADGTVLLQTFGGARQLAADPSAGASLEEGSAGPAPFRKVPTGEGFALGTPDGKHWLSVSGDGKLVFAKLAAPGAAETFTAEPALRTHNRCCCGPSVPLPSTVLWDDLGHRAIVEQGIACLRNPWSPTPESKRFVEIWDSDTNRQAELWSGLREPDYDDNLDDNWTYSSHFYDPDTKNNYWADLGFFNPGPTALERGCEFFRASVTQYANPIPSAETSFQLLGWALHYLTDLSQPMHAANVPNVFGDTGFPAAWDWRHSKWEAYAEGVAQSGKLFENYPRLTVEEMSIDGYVHIEELFDQVARASKAVWRNEVKSIFDRKWGCEAWGPEAADALTHATHMAPVAVAKLLSWWTREAAGPA